MNTDWPSTKALSVYNALSLSGRDMTREEIGSFLREAWDPTVDESYVDTGVQFLLVRGFVHRYEGTIVIKRYQPTRMGRPLIRANNDAELVYGQ